MPWRLPHRAAHAPRRNLMRRSLHAAHLAGWLICAIALAAPTQAAWLSLDGSTSPAEPRIDVVADTPSLLQLEVAVPGMTAEERATPEGSDTHVTIPGHGHTLEIGAPAIPVVNFIVEVPHGARCEVQSTASAARSYALGTDGLQSRLYPAQPSQRKVDARDALGDFQRDLDAYQRPGFVPEELVTLREMGIMRGHRLLLVQAHPVAYDPVAGELLAHDRIAIMIQMQGADLAGTQAELRRTHSPVFETLLARHVVNHGSFLGGPREFPLLPIGLLIVSAPGLEGAVAPLADWKTQKGYHTTLVTTDETGSSVGQIEDYIANAYNNWEIPPTWVLLVGDTDTIPYRVGSSSSSATDLYYTTITGGDFLPELHVGRLAGRTTTEIGAMVEKAVSSERMELTNGTDFMNTATWIASSDMGAFAEGTHNYCIEHWFDPAGINSIRIYERLGGSTQDIRDAINGGTLMANYSGHGSTNMWNCVPFTQTDIRNLTNNDMYPLIISNACLTGDYASSECYGETWVRVADKGGVAHFGASTYSYWDEDDILEKELWRHFWEEDDYTIGQMCDGGLLGVYEYYA
ncbi:MAG: hypothetical protein GF330_14575, partial [Candidatus Eisenbacteria bacterium]|nr:hypothetical protein [Candidatus Eisenbacteria bacterium]